MPTDANEYTDGTAVQAVQPAKKTVEATDGTWKFLKYDADSKTIAGSDVKFTGTWTFEANRPKDPDKTPIPQVQKMFLYRQLAKKFYRKLVVKLLTLRWQQDLH